MPQGRGCVLKLYTSRWGNRGLSRLPVVPVGISRGTPKFPVPYRYRMARLLAPSRQTFALRDDADFERAYLTELEDAGVDRIGGLLKKISDEEGGRDLCLLCYEADPRDCHRGMFARWWFKQTGQPVEEMGQSCRSSHHRQDAHGRLFE